MNRDANIFGNMVEDDGNQFEHNGTLYSPLPQEQVHTKEASTDANRFRPSTLK